MLNDEVTVGLESFGFAAATAAITTVAFIAAVTFVTFGGVAFLCGAFVTFGGVAFLCSAFVTFGGTAFLYSAFDIIHRVLTAG